MLIVKLNFSATKPIAAGANKIEEKPIVVILTTVVGILSLDCLTACLITKGTKLAIKKP